MNEATPVPDHSCDLLISAESAPGPSVIPGGAEVTIPVYRAPAGQRTGRKFMDFFAPRRRQSAEQAVPTYRALTEPPIDSDEIAPTEDFTTAPTD